MIRIILILSFIPFFLIQCKTQHVDRKALAEQVKTEYDFAWQNYKKYAWGSDELKPLSQSGHNWYGQSLQMTPIDALDGLIILGFDTEADSVGEWIAAETSWDKDINVQVFEVTIRLMGGLLTSYQMTGDGQLLDLAVDLADRLLPAFESETGMPYRYVNLKTGALSDPNSNPAEIATLMLEFGTLSRLTQNPVYYQKAKQGIRALFEKRPANDLPGQSINVETGAWTNQRSHIGGMIDSYYEYLLKSWLLFDDADFRHMWDVHITALNSHLAVDTNSGFWYGRVDMHTGNLNAAEFGALEAFFPAVLALAGDTVRARKLMSSCLKMWSLHNLEPEVLNFEEMQIPERGAFYYLRPEIIESLYYLFHFTADEKFLIAAKKIFEDIQKYCRTENGYTIIRDVRSKEKGDLMPSYFLAETLKYLYLLFSDTAPVGLDDYIFTTEAHPLKKAAISE